MTISSWDPNGTVDKSNNAIDIDTVSAFLTKAETLSDKDVALTLDESELAKVAPLMHHDEASWSTVITDFSDDQLIALIRFFALAEDLPGCEANEHSPVIPMARLLRQRDNKLDRDFLLWLRKVNRNRYIPYGPL